MGMGPIALTCLLLTVHQAPVQEIPFASRDMGIGIKIDAAKRARLSGFNLLVSHDRGGVWTIADHKPANAESFSYHAREDGSYWFIIQEEDKEGNKKPLDTIRARPNQCILVDTVKPQIQVTAEHLPSGEVHFRWNISEKYPEESSLRLDYQTDGRPDHWTPLPLQKGMSGESKFPPGNNIRQVVVRVRMADKAGNIGVGEARVSMAGGGGIARGGSEGPFVVPTMRTEKGAAPGQLASRQSVRPLEATPQALPTPSAPAPMPAPEELNPAGNAPTLGMTNAPERPAATAGLATDTPHGALPPLKIVNKPEVRLDFEVGKVGPSGLGNADVYVTFNEGASWSKLPNEVPLNLPSGAETRGPGPVRGSVNVQLPKEQMIYGFIVAVKSKAGRSRPAPQAGEPPQVRVELDKTAPKANLFGPVPNAEQPNSLVLSWFAEDRNLPANGVTLEWAERKEGPWNLIGDKLPNTSANGPLPRNATGSYIWQLPERMPASVYLKLSVRDTASNLAVAQAGKPILIDLSIPETSGVVVSPGAR